MMKYFYILVLIVFWHAASAQKRNPNFEEKADLFEFGVGINSGYILKKIIQFGDIDSLYGNPYLINGSIIFKDKYFARLSLGGSRLKTLEQEDGFLDKKVSIDYRSNIRFGLGALRNISKNWQFTGSIDGVFRSSGSNKLDDSGFDQIETISQDQAFGGGFSGSLVYKINLNFSLSVESAVYWLKGTRDKATIFRNVPELSDINIKTQTEEIQTILPSTIFVTYYF